MHKLSIRNLTKRYGDFVALHEASLELPSGEFLTLLGPSGSGKTTLLMILAGLTSPDSGEVRIDGKLATYAPPHLRDIGLVFQNYALFPHLTVYENIAFPMRMRGAGESEIRASVGRVLDIVGLPHLADRLPSELSGGQQQRVAVGRCAVYQPSIILMDEPLSALDKKLRDQMQGEVKRIHIELGATILYVTHDQEEAMALSDRICLMNEGRIEQIGSPADLYFRPASMFAAQFLGGANLLPAQVASQADGLVSVIGPGGVRIEGHATTGTTFEKGEPAKVMIRPEHFDFHDRMDGAATLDVEITESIMVGPLTRHYGTLADGTPIVVNSLTRRAAQTTFPLRTGLSWSSNHVVVLKATVDEKRL